LNLLGNTWDEYPIIYSNYRLPAFPRIRIDMKSSHVDNDEGEQSNHFNLPSVDANSRQVMKVDLTTDSESNSTQSHMESREGNSKESTPLTRMCVYILLECEVNLMLPSQIRLKSEELACNHITDVLIQLHRLTNTWKDDWKNLRLVDSLLEFIPTEHIPQSEISLDTIANHALPACPSPVPTSFQKYAATHHNLTGDIQNPSSKPMNRGRSRFLRARL